MHAAARHRLTARWRSFTQFVEKERPRGIPGHDESPTRTARSGLANHLLLKLLSIERQVESPCGVGITVAGEKAASVDEDAVTDGIEGRVAMKVGGQLNLERRQRVLRGVRRPRVGCRVALARSSRAPDDDHEHRSDAGARRVRDSHGAQHTILWPALAVAVVFLAASACTTKPGSTGPSDAAPMMPAAMRPAHFVDGGRLPDAGVKCAGVPCPEPRASQVLGEAACCLPTGECGIGAPLLADRCLTPNQPGSVDPSCPSFAGPNGAVAQGCCAPSGRCGYYDRFGDLGCVVADTSDAGQRCDYDAANTCRSVVAVSCDGSEDCGAGRVCCARSNFGLYDAFGCFTSCAAAEATYRGVWVEVCHSPADCPAPTDRCEAAPGLFASVNRCAPQAFVPPSDAALGAENDAGSSDVRTNAGAAPDAETGGEDGVVCGASLCPRGRPCCARDPGAPYCAPEGEGCSCSGPHARERAREQRD